MNDAITAAQGSEEVESMDAQDFVEMGSVSEETKGSLLGDDYDGHTGWWKI